MLIKKKKYLIPILSFLLLYFSPFLFKGTQAFVSVHDSLDSVNLIGIFDKTIQGDFFISDQNPEYTLPGVEHRYSLRTISFDKLLFYLFGYFWGYFLNEVIYRLFAFSGMLLLIKSIKKGLEFPESYQILLALSFASLPFYAHSNLSIAGLPMLLYSFKELYLDKEKILPLIYISFFAFYSSFVLSGFFIGILIIISFLYLIIIKKLNLWLFLGSVILITSYLLSHYNLFLNQIFYDVPTNRNETSPLFFAKNTDALIEFLKILYYNQNHATTNHAIIILPTVFVLVFDNHDSSRMPKLIMSILLFIFTTALIVGLSYFTSFIELIGPVGGFTWNRLYWFNPMMWYILFSILIIELYNFYSINIKFLFSIILLSFIFGFKYFVSVDSIFLLLLLLTLSILFFLSQKIQKFKKRNRLIILSLLITQISINTYTFTYKGFFQKPSFKDFFSEEQFNDLTKTLDLDKSNIRIGCIGFYPSVANYNGFKTLGAYENIYPLKFKNKFYRIIKNEIKQNKNLYDYFTKSGSRLYLYDNEIGMPYYDQQPRLKLYHPEITCDLNIPLMKELGTSHIFSTSKIKNAKQKNLELIHISEKPYYFYKLYIYVI